MPLHLKTAEGNLRLITEPSSLKRYAWLSHAIYRAALLQMFVLFERKCPAKWTLQDISSWFQFEVNVFHSKCIEVCEMWIKIVYVRGIRCHIHLCLKMLLSTKQWMNVSKWSKLQQISPAEGVGSNGLGVDRLSAPILSILPIIDIGHFKNRFADNFFFLLLCKQTYYLQVTLFIGE